MLQFQTMYFLLPILDTLLHINIITMLSADGRGLANKAVNSHYDGGRWEVGWFKKHFFARKNFRQRLYIDQGGQ